MRRARLGAVFIAFAAAAFQSLAQQDPPNGLLLVAKPGMPDPRFRETVILVTQARDGQTVGVVLNKPLRTSLSELMPGPQARDYRGPVFYGGPVMERVVVALFRSAERPAAPSFHVLRDIYLSMHPGAVTPLLGGDGRKFRLYAGFSGWAPGQLDNEIKLDGWHLLPATEEILFREDTSRLWMELVGKARGFRTRAALEPRAILLP
jgi:putative transcriptional regulator